MTHAEASPALDALSPLAATYLDAVLKGDRDAFAQEKRDEYPGEGSTFVARLPVSGRAQDGHDGRG